MIRTIEDAKAYRAKIENAANSLEDAEASLAVELSRSMKNNNTLISTGTRINWNGTLKRAAVDLYDTTENSPDNAPSLWEDILYRDGYRIILETITAGTAFANGERGWWGDSLYESVVDNNIWTPSAYPSGWKINII